MRGRCASAHDRTPATRTIREPPPRGCSCVQRASVRGPMTRRCAVRAQSGARGHLNRSYNRRVMSLAWDPARTAWLFTRGRESVRLQVVPSARGVTLRVAGPGPKRASYDFADMVTLLQHQTDLEGHLVAQGYSLEQFLSER